MILITVLLLVIPQIFAENIVLLDLPPEEADKYLQNTNPQLKYAEQIGEGPVAPETYYRGNIIENPDQFIEKTYNANQFHGQNGLGKAKFGYTDWNQARYEDINVHGKTEGSYQYALPNGKNYEVKYWADANGFHQTDNRPEIELQPVTDTPAVKAAKAAFEKAWAEAAATNLVPVTDTPAVRAARLAHRQSLIDAGLNPDAEASEGSYDWAKYHDGDGPTGPPRGFYYNFDYPVKLIVDKNDPEQRK